MGIAVIVVFLFVAIVCYIEDKLPLEQKKKLFYFVGMVLIIMPAIREVGLDPDSENYEKVFHNYLDEKSVEHMEYSYILLSQIFSIFTSDVHILFLFYAIFGVTLKMAAIKKCSEMWFLPLLIYISYTYLLHEFTQIRTGIMSGLFLLAIRPIVERKYLPAIILIAIGVFFHTSALMLLPLLFLSNEEMNIKKRLFWVGVIPVAYALYVVGATILVNIPIPFIEAKLMNYEGEEMAGVSVVSVNVFSPLHLFTTFLFLYLMFFYDTIKEKDPYFTFMLKVFALSIFSYTALAFLPVLAERVCYLLRIVTIFLFADIAYTIKPRWVGISVAVLVAFLYLNYAFVYIDFELLIKN